MMHSLYKINNEYAVPDALLHVLATCYVKPFYDGKVMDRRHNY